MSLSHAILGFLRYGPRTGYDLKRIFDSSVRHFWPAQQSHIYQALSRLADDGFATVEVVPQENRPSQKVYSLTEEGATELHEWLTKLHPERPVRAPFLIQLFFAGGLEDEEILEVLEVKARELRERLAAFEGGSVAEPTYAKDLPEREQFFWYLTLDYGIESLRLALDWIERVVDRIRRKEYDKGIEGALTERSPA